MKQPSLCPGVKALNVVVWQGQLWRGKCYAVRGNIHSGLLRKGNKTPLPTPDL